MHFQRFLPVLLTLVMVSCTSRHERAATVVFTPAPGSVRIVDVSITANFSADQGENRTTLTDYRFEFTPVGLDPDGTVTLKSTIILYNSERSGMIHPIEETIVSGDDPSGEKAIRNAMESIKGESFTIRVDKRGRLLGISGLETLATKVLSQLKTADTRTQSLAQILVMDQLGAVPMMETLRAVFPANPDIPLRLGYSRQGTSVLRYVGNPVIEELQLTVRDRSETTVFVDVQTSYSIDMKDVVAGSGTLRDATAPVKSGESVSAEVAPDAVDGDMKKLLTELSVNPQQTGTGRGAIAFDMKTGWIVRSAITGTMSRPVKSTFKTTVRSHSN